MANEFGLTSQQMRKIEKATRMFLEAIGEDLEREGLRETPNRVARMWDEFFKMRNYTCKEFAESSTLVNGFILVKNIPLNSLCEHHLVPFVGKANVAYIPKSIDEEKKHVIGISKIARIVYKHSYRPQVQERLTVQILNEVKDVTQTEDVIVHIDAQHLCMTMRGARAPEASTVTMDYSGVFKTDPMLRQEFLNFIR